MVRGARFHPRVIWSRLKARIPVLIWIVAIVFAVFLATLNTKGTYFAGVLERSVIEVGPTIAGTIASIEVASGQLVTNGQVLARLDLTDLETQKGAAAWDRAMEILTVDRELTSLGYDIKSRIDARKLSLAEDKAELLAIDQELARFAELVEQRAITYDPQVEANFKAKRQALIEAVRMYPESIANLEEYYEWAKGQKELLLFHMDPPEGSESQMVDSVDKIRLEMAKTVITSPASGLISTINLPIGQYIQAGTSLMSVMPTNTPQIIAMAEEGTSLLPQIGQVFQVRPLIGSGDTYYTAVVTSVAQDIAQLNLETGMFFATVKRGRYIRLKFTEPVPLLPGQAVTVLTKRPIWHGIKTWCQDKWQDFRYKPEASTAISEEG